MYHIENSKDNQFYFTLRAKNGEIIATSEMYERKESCYVGIESIKKNAESKIIDKTKKKSKALKI
jgi:uncharacterized protein YegP (UPF0339 family)